MGKALEITYHHGVVTLMIDPFATYRAELTKEGGGDFLILMEIENPHEKNERDTGRIVGFEIADIFTITAEEIPEIDGLYDIEEMSISDFTIKEIVLWLQKKTMEEIRQRKTA